MGRAGIPQNGAARVKGERHMESDAGAVWLGLGFLTRFVAAMIPFATAPARLGSGRICPHPLLFPNEKVTL